MKRLFLLFLFPFLLYSQSRSILFEDDQTLPFTMTINASSYTISMKGTGRISVNNGDGTTTNYTLTSSAQNVTHSYGSSALRTVKIYNSLAINYWSCSDNAAYAFNWSQTKKMMLTYFYCTGSNTLSGTLSLPSGMTYFYCAGSNTLSGTLSLPSGMTTFTCVGFNTLSGYTTQSFSQSMNYFYLITSNGTGFTAAQIDQLCIDLNGSAWGGSSKTLRLTGSKIGAPTSASAAARSAMALRSISITTN